MQSTLGLEEGFLLGDAEVFSLGFSLGDRERNSLGDTEEPLPSPLPSPLPLPLLLTRDPLAFLIPRLSRNDWAKAAGAISSAEVAAAVANFILPVVGFQAVAAKRNGPNFCPVRGAVALLLLLLRVIGPLLPAVNGIQGNIPVFFVSACLH